MRGRPEGVLRVKFLNSLRSLRTSSLQEQYPFRILFTKRSRFYEAPLLTPSSPVATRHGSACSSPDKTEAVQFFRPRKKSQQGLFLRDLLDDIRTRFERINDTTIYIPDFSIERSTILL